MVAGIELEQYATGHETSNQRSEKAELPQHKPGSLGENWYNFAASLFCNAQALPWKSKTKQRMVFRMIHIKDSLLPMGKVWSLDSLGLLKTILTLTIAAGDCPTVMILVRSYLL